MSEILLQTSGLTKKYGRHKAVDHVNIHITKGAIYGFCGALVAIIPINIVQGYLQKMHEFFMMPAYSYSQGLVVFSVLLIGVLFSAGGSFMSIKKHLQV